MKKFVSENIEDAKLYPPGTPLEEIKRLYGMGEVIKLNANENCLGPSPMAVKAIADSASQIHRYPDNSGFYLKQKLEEAYGVSSEQIIFGNGSNELVQFILMTFLLPGQEVITAKPTFLLYSIMGRVLGGSVKEIPLKDFTYDLGRMAQEISDNTKLIFISNPNNPTGTIVKGDIFQQFMEKVPDDVIVVMDEAYGEYVTDRDFPDTLEYIRQGRNIIILHTFSKAYGLAGLRLGFALGSSRLIQYLEKIREPFNANALAQKAALAALNDEAHLERTRENNRMGISAIGAGLQKLQLSFVPTQTNFLLIDLGPKADMIHTMLLKEGVMVRAMSSFGLNDYVRVTIGLPEENRKFLEILEKVMKSAMLIL